MLELPLRPPAAVELRQGPRSRAAIWESTYSTPGEMKPDHGKVTGGEDYGMVENHAAFGIASIELSRGPDCFHSSANAILRMRFTFEDLGHSSSLRFLQASTMDSANKSRCFTISSADFCTIPRTQISASRRLNHCLRNISARETSTKPNSPNNCYMEGLRL